MFIQPTNETGRILAARTAYSGHIFDVIQQTIETPDGLRVERDLIKHAPAVALLAMTADDQVLVNREYRVGINAEAYALPAGLIDPGETPDAAAKRELEEETGYVAQSLQPLCAVRSSEGMTDEVVHLYYAQVDQKKRIKQHFDRDEFVTSQFVPLPDVIAAVQDGRIASAQSVSALSYYLAFVRNA
ncbi:NUDIX hydrolase [Lacticaseibacillus baoqingensis]|uniref:NUDIX hydrolase n=1 Tax=Lacticaseibacillus baoqingensis TaxID=2486013 RepID=A0ABW4EAS7_9LACO|nr:NUDIX hydrolase [Lacticaseibacillus baoqingensis]